MNPSTKRIAFLLLLVVGILGIIATVYFLFLRPGDAPVAPVVDQTRGGALPANAPIPAIPVATSTAPAPSPDSAAEQERKAREALFRRAREIAARSATYSSVDRFDAISQVFIDVSPELRTTLAAEQNRLIQEVGTGSRRQTTRALSARLTQDVLVRSASTVQVEVDTQQVTQDGGTSATRLRRATMQLQKQGDTWIATSLTWGDLPL